MAACATGATTTPTTAESRFDTTVIEISGIELSVWVADTAEERRQGLRGAADLPVDGMLFVWDSPTTPTFGMRDTLIPLDIWWFDADGALIGMTEMDTCPSGDCLAYPAPGPIRWALETPRGIFEFETGAMLTPPAG